MQILAISARTNQSGFVFNKAQVSSFSFISEVALISHQCFEVTISIAYFYISIRSSQWAKHFSTLN